MCSLFIRCSLSAILHCHQAYVCTFALSSTKSANSGEITLILVAAAAEPELFKELHRGRRYIEQVLLAKRLHAVIVCFF